MTREFKFRVWDKKENRMRFVDSIRFDGVVLLDPGYGLESRKPEDVELMQYTGFKDSTDCEIYEGDILKKQNYKLNGQKNGSHYKVMKFINGRFPMFYLNDCKVVGNVFENPKLLVSGETNE